MLVLALSAVLTASCSRPTEEPRVKGLRPHLVLLTIDTLRADHMSLYGYQRATTPFLERLAEESVVFDRAIAQWPKTGTSFASMFIGRFPNSTGLTHKASLQIPAAYGLLPEAMQNEGYKTLAVVSNEVLSKDSGWDRGFDDYRQTWSEEPSNDPRHYRPEVAATRVNAIAKELLATHGYGAQGSASAPDRPLFLWLHYSDPHSPYLLLEGVENPFDDDALYQASPPNPVIEKLTRPQGRVISGVTELRDYVSLYDANVLEVDKALANIVDHLKQVGVFERAWTFLTADHGESLGEHDLYFEHGPLPYNTTSHVPLMVRPPALQASAFTSARIAQPVELVDLAPTIADLLLPSVNGEFPEPETTPSADTASPTGVTEAAQSCASTLRGSVADRRFEGSSLRPFLSGGPSHQVAAGELEAAFAEAGRSGGRRFRSLQEERFKLVFKAPRSDRRPGPQDFQLYDLISDPLETDNVRDDHPEVVRKLSERLLELTDQAHPSLTETQRPCSNKELETLKRLGYLN